MPARYDVYAATRDERCRFALGRRGARNLFVIGLNPSTATRDRADTTVTKVERVARRAGFDGFVMLNLYPVRATDVAALPRDLDVAATQRNLAMIERVVSQERAASLWAAWGTLIRARPDFVTAAAELVARLRRYRPRWQHFGPLTGDGHPRHPSRAAYAWSFGPFDVDGYLQQVQRSRPQVACASGPRWR